MTLRSSNAKSRTRDRLLAAGIRLFAERGFSGTTVGDIEAACGLEPRRGAMYYYFPSKLALLEAAVEAHLAAIEQGLQRLDAPEGVTIRSQALALGRWFLTELDTQQYLCRVLEQEGERLPQIRELVRTRIIEVGHLAVERAVRRWLGAGTNVDTEAIAILLVGPLVNLRRAAWTFGSAPLGVDDERLLNAWADAWALLAEHLAAAN
jgi:AcrR family transcriptional regulator